MHKTCELQKAMNKYVTLTLEVLSIISNKFTLLQLPLHQIYSEKMTTKAKQAENVKLQSFIVQTGIQIPTMKITKSTLRLHYALLHLS